MSQTSNLSFGSSIDELLNMELLSAPDDDLSLPSAITMPEGYKLDNGPRNKIGRCILTMFVPDTDDKWIQPETYWASSSTNVLQNWVAQFEECPTTERLHVQAYAEFNHENRPRFNELKVMIRRVTGTHGNIAVAKRASLKQRDSAVNYCMKPDSRYHGSNPFVWGHNQDLLAFNQELYDKRPSKKVSKEDLKDQQVDYIESKPMHWTWDQIVHESDASKKLLAACAWGPKYHAGRHASNARRTVQNVIVLYGAGGTGKTTMALDWDARGGETKQARYYKRNADDGKFWGGGRTAYKGQRIIHLEEFCGSETSANLKEICDLGKEGPSVNIKNSGTELNHDTVIITSNYHPAAWYRTLMAEDPKQWWPICRRFTKVLFFPAHKDDGALNAPESEEDYYYEDQTETFKSDEMKDYNKALEHANAHWPLREKVDFVEPATKRQKTDSFEEYCRTGRFD